MNRVLPIRLEAVGDVFGRSSPIGNPKLEFLPANRERIAAELRGMVERWKAEGRPLDQLFGPAATECVRTVGGILMVNGFSGFLGNLAERKGADDPVRFALGRVETDDECVTLRLEKCRKRFGEPNAKTRYRFVVLEKTERPAED